MVEHKIITFHKQDVIEALEDYYLKTKGEKIDINFDARSLEYSTIREIIVKVVSMNTEGLKAELEPTTHNEISEVIYSGGSIINTYNTTYDPTPNKKSSP